MFFIITFILEDHQWYLATHHYLKTTPKLQINREEVTGRKIHFPLKQIYWPRHQGVFSKFWIITDYKVYQTLIVSKYYIFGINLKSSIFSFHVQILQLIRNSLFQNKSVNLYFDRLPWCYDYLELFTYNKNR